MSAEQEFEEGSERPRPRVVDKRISARPAAQDPAPGVRPDDRPGERAPTTGSGPAPEPQAPPADSGPGTGSETFRPPPAAEPGPGDAGDLWTPEMEDEARRVAEDIARVPARDWVINSAVNLANVAGVKLQQGHSDEARLAIDALAAILTDTGDRLGDAAGPMRQLLAQLQLAFAERAAPPTPGSPPPG